MTKTIEKAASFSPNVIATSQRGRAANIAGERGKLPPSRVQSGNRLERTFSPTPSINKQTNNVLLKSAALTSAGSSLSTSTPRIASSFNPTTSNETNELKNLVNKQTLLLNKLIGEFSLYRQEYQRYVDELRQSINDIAIETRNAQNELSFNINKLLEQKNQRKDGDKLSLEQIEELKCNLDVDLSDNPDLLWSGISMYCAGPWNPTGNLNTYGLSLMKIMFTEEDMAKGSFLPTRPSNMYPTLDEKRSWIIIGCYYLRFGGKLDVFMVKWKTIVKSLRQACHDIRKAQKVSKGCDQQEDADEEENEEEFTQARNQLELVYDDEEEEDIQQTRRIKFSTASFVDEESQEIDNYQTEYGFESADVEEKEEELDEDLMKQKRKNKKKL